MKVCFCTAAKNRTNHVKETLAKNMAGNPGHTFVMLDYNSDDLDSVIQSAFRCQIASGQLVYYRNKDARVFLMTHAKNSAHRCGMLENADILCNLDADNFAPPGFGDYIKEIFDRTKLDPQEPFLWSRMAKGKIPRGISGRIVVSKNAFLCAGGYDEAPEFQVHSPDDRDCNLRLRRLGFNAFEIDSRFLQCVAHNDRMRFKQYPEAKEMQWIMSPINRVVNNGHIGCGTVFRNFDPTPIQVPPIPTRVFGIGMHKTATTSLHAAFTLLGFKSGHWENAHWAKAVWVEMRHLGKSQSLERFYAASDTPIPQLYRELDKAYPNSKFILTVRDEKDWLDSARRHFNPQFNPFARAWDDDPFTHRMHRHIYGTEKFDAALFLAAYRRHNAEVLAYFKDRPDDLVVMDMSQKAGWKELCGFLGVPVPNVAYPTMGTMGLTAQEESPYS